MQNQLITKIRLRNVFCVILAVIAFMDSSVMYNEYTGGKLLTYSLKFICVVMIPFLLQKVEGWGKIYLFVLVIPLAWGVIDEDSLLLTIQYFFSAGIPLMAFALLKNEEKKIATDSYLRLFKFFCYIGIPLYIILNITLLPHTIFVRNSDHRHYYNYFWLYLRMAMAIYKRVFVPFLMNQELLAHLSALYFYILEAISREELILLSVFGYTYVFSIHHYSISFNCIFLKFEVYTLEEKNKKIVIFLMALILCYFTLNVAGRYTKGKGVYEVMIYNRFEWKDNWIVGFVNNRDAGIKGFDKAYYDFFSFDNSNLWFGHGKFAVQKQFGSSGLSYRIYIYEKGLVSVIYIALFFIFLHDWKRENILFNLFSLMFLTALFFQRPYLYSLPFFILIYTGIRIVPKYIGNSKDKHYGII